MMNHIPNVWCVFKFFFNEYLLDKRVEKKHASWYSSIFQYSYKKLRYMCNLHLNIKYLDTNAMRLFAQSQNKSC